MPQPRPTAAYVPPADPLALLQATATPLLQVNAEGRVCWANLAAEQALGATPGCEVGTLWQAPSDCGIDQAQATCSGQWYHAQRAALADGSSLWSLQPARSTELAQAKMERLQKQLDLARQFGRLGLWERHVRSLQGHWDREVLRFWGMDPEGPTPDLAAALDRVLPEDRAALRDSFLRSLQQAGQYSMRYRVRALDGQVRRIHSQWVVKNGADGRPELAQGVVMDDTEPYALAGAAQELESQLALTVQVSGIAIWRHDLATGRMHYSAEGWRALGLQPRPEGLTLEEVRALIHPDDLPAVVASADAALRSAHPVDVEARYRHKNGSWRHQTLRRTVLRDEQGQPIAFLGVAMDVTERLEERRKTTELLQRFETVTRLAGIGHWIFEPGQATATWSDELRRMFGLSPQAPIPSLSDWLKTHVHPDDAPALLQALTAWGRTGSTSLETSFRVRRGPGEVRQFHGHSLAEDTGRGMRRFGVLIDITEQRRSQMALQSAEERMGMAVRGAGLGTWEVDLDTLDEHWDAQMWVLRGHAPQPQPMTRAEREACLHPEDRNTLRESVRRALRSGEVMEHEFRVVWPDGQERWLASRSMEISDPSGRGLRRIGVNWDITDRRTADTARREREVALRESKAKSQFMARMSHELRTPLNAVLGFTQLLLSDSLSGSLTDEASPAKLAVRLRHLKHIQSAGQHLLSLINDVLQLSGVAGGEVSIALEPVPLQGLLDSTLPLLGPLLNERGTRMRAGPLAGAAMADTTRLRQVLLNLLSNAIKYNRAGGEVRVSSQLEGDRVVVTVADEGCGMDEAQQRHLFEPFNRLGADRSAVEGTGIGLAIVKALTERMGGRVSVRSTPGQGSVFEISLAAAPDPAAAAHVAQQAPQRAPVAGAGQARRRVLYVQDNPVNALIISELLSRRGDLDLHHAVDGRSGVALAIQLQPDLILLDMQLPDFDGYEVLRQLRAQPGTAAIPCIALSANAMPQDIQRALKAGMADYWTKPLDFKAFMASLDAVFGPHAH